MQSSPHLHQVRRDRLDRRARRDAAIAALYPYARTFVAVNLHAIDERESAGVADLPRTLTLVTPDHADPSRDHLFIGPYAVLRRDLTWRSEFEELSFSTNADGRRIQAQLHLTHSRTRAFGSLHIDGVDLAVEYALAPQRYAVRMVNGLARVSPQPKKIMFDADAPAWQDAHWGDEVLRFRFGPTGLGRMDDSDDMTLDAEFVDLPGRTSWRPGEAASSCRIDDQGRLVFEQSSSARPTSLVPHTLRLRFGATAGAFDGGMLTGAAVAYGIRGTCDGGNVAGLYRLRGDAAPDLIGVHDRELYVGYERVRGAVLSGQRISWSDLPAAVAARTGLPATGHLDFSPDGATVVAFPAGFTGRRVAPDDVADLHRARERHVARLGSTVGMPPYTMTDILSMTQFAVDPHGMYFDEIQSQSMGDFYQILQHYMDPDLRRRYFSVRQPELSPAVAAIARRVGNQGTEPASWYRSMGTAYVPGARSSDRTSTERVHPEQHGYSDVMAVQSPLLYQNRYTVKYSSKLDWFRLDQRADANQEKYRSEVDHEMGRIKEQVRTGGGTDEEKATVLAELDAFATTVKEERLYWAFRLYVHASRSASMNLLQSVIEDPTNDGSMYTQHIQRTVAQLNALDPTFTVAGEYARLLQLFQVGNLLPQLMDFGGDIEMFNVVVGQIVAAFVARYRDAADPALREAAAQLRTQATEVVCECLRSAAGDGAGPYPWAAFADRFVDEARRRLGSTDWVASGILLAAVGVMLGLAMTGNIVWTDLSEVDRALVVTTGVGIVAAGVIHIARGVAVGELFVPGQGFWSQLRTVVGPSTLARAQTLLMTEIKGWLLNTAYGDRLDRLISNRQIGGAIRYGRRIAGQRALAVIFGRNMREFIATRLGAAVAASGIVMSAIALHRGGEPVEAAIRALFVVSSCLEFIAAAAGWGLAAAGVTTVDGMAVGSLLAAVCVVGLVAPVAGFIRMIVTMIGPKDRVTNESASLSGPYAKSIEPLERHQPLSERTGVTLEVGGLTHSLRISGERAPLDYTGLAAPLR